MSDQQQPDVRWAPIEPKPANRGRVWLIVGLVVAALVIVGALLFFLLPRGEAADPGATESPSPSASPSDTVVPSATPEPTVPVETAPPTIDPSVDEFRGQVSPWLDDALTGLDIVATTEGEEARAVVETLQQDAQRLAETPPPSSIEAAWREGVQDYGQRLDALRAAVADGSGAAAAVEDARAAAQHLRSIIGL